jgi:MOSC domain-containing protein YiiM
MWVAAIYTAAESGAPPSEVEQAWAVPGKGIRGDRHYDRKRGPEFDITLVEMEAIEAVRREYGLDLSPAATRRQIVTRAVPLNHLVGHEFQIGAVRLRGIKLCEPCPYLASLTNPIITDALRHRGGLRAQILTEGPIRKGDSITT